MSLKVLHSVILLEFSGDDPGMESSNPIGPIIGGVFGGLIVLLLLLLLIVMGVVLAVTVSRWKSDKAKATSNDTGIHLH